MSHYRFLCWLYGAGFALVFLMLQVAISQRDEARSVRARLGTDELVCKVVRHD